jgi:hypothetical protein
MKKFYIFLLNCLLILICGSIIVLLVELTEKLNFPFFLKIILVGFVIGVIHSVINYFIERYQNRKKV